MGDVGQLLLALLCSFAGMVWFALALEPHWRLVRAGDSRSVTTLRVLGTLALLSSLWLCLRADHASMAVLVWFMYLSLSAVAVAVTLDRRPRLLAVWVAWLQ